MSSGRKRILYLSVITSHVYTHEHEHHCANAWPCRRRSLWSLLLAPPFMLHSCSTCKCSSGCRRHLKRVLPRRNNRRLPASLLIAHLPTQHLFRNAPPPSHTHTHLGALKTAAALCEQVNSSITAFL